MVYFRFKNLLLASLASSVFFTSCKKESSQPSWDLNILAPILKSSISINNLVTDTLLKSNADSSVKIVYNSDLINYNLDTIAKVPDTTVHLTFITPIPNYNYSGGTLLLNSAQEIDFKLNNIYLNKAVIKSQFVRLYIENRIDSTVAFTYEVPCATNGVGHFILKDSVAGKTGTTPAIYDTILDFSGYTLDLTGINGTSTNAITTKMEAHIGTNVSYVIIPHNDSLYVVNTAYNIKPSYARGYLGQTLIDVGPEESSFSLFNSVKSGILSLPQTKVTLNLENSVGVDARLKISKISSINSRTGTTVDLASTSVINKSVNINRALETGNAASPVLPSTQTIVLNSSNSNVGSFIGNMPDKLSYTMQVNVNPLGNASGSNDFIFAGYGIKAKMNIEIPLSLVATKLTLSDTLMLDLSSITGQEKILNGNLYLYATNGLPLNATIQIYLLDKNLNKTDSLMVPPNNVIASALLDVTNKVKETVETKLTIPVSKEKIAKLVTTKKALVLAYFNTANQPNPVNIYNYYKLDFKLVADFGYSNSSTKK
ncbi:MAG: hypothetical protein IT235_04095 [Bacteroidia bacterium]|nr:hypothetical protein [Bacteroidia bacterium]